MTKNRYSLILSIEVIAFFPKKRKKKISLEDFPLPNLSEPLIEEIAKKLSEKIDKEALERRYASTKDVLKLVGAGVFLTASIAMPGLPRVLKSFVSNDQEYRAWKRFNIVYLKRTLSRLEKQRFVEVGEEKGMQVVKITDRGRKKILKFALDEIGIEKPKLWDKKWRLVSYDIPTQLKSLRDVVREYLSAWRFYPLHESVFLHAYPCEKQVEFLREYLGIGKYVRIFTVSYIENDVPFREFYGL